MLLEQKSGSSAQRGVLLAVSYCPWLQPLDSDGAPGCLSLMESAVTLPQGLVPINVQFR